MLAQRVDTRDRVIARANFWFEWLHSDCSRASSNLYGTQNLISNLQLKGPLDNSMINRSYQKEQGQQVLRRQRLTLESQSNSVTSAFLGLQQSLTTATKIPS